jgi:RNA polymerase sigma-70 factor (ECF subfamily)
VLCIAWLALVSPSGKSDNGTVPFLNGLCNWIMAPTNGTATMTDLELVQQAKGGKLDAFTELVNRHERKIFRLTQHITGSREDAEDALQETFLKAFSRLPQFQGDSQFYTWLVRIAVNESLMKLRKRRAHPTVSLDEPIQTEDDFVPREHADWDDNPEQRYAQQELRDILDQAVQSLPPIFRAVFVLRDLEDLSTEETAQMLSLSVPAVKSRLLRARLQLREKLSKHFRRGIAA